MRQDLGNVLQGKNRLYVGGECGDGLGPNGGGSCIVFGKEGLRGTEVNAVEDAMRAVIRRASFRNIVGTNSRIGVG
jgi:hypothetical protein